MLVPSLALAQAVPAPPASFDLEAAMREGPPMTEARAVELALANSTSAEQARAQTRAAQAQVAAARVAMVPRLELTARYSHVDGFPDGTIGLMDPAAVEQARAAANRVTDPAARGLFLAQIDTQARGTSIAIPRDQIGFQARLTFPVSDLFFAMLPALESSEAALRAQRRRAEVADNDVRRMTREA
ncbi:MAG: TolC family protein, partial [Sandaracinaceae bacterium]|nr:TolC family protein [Sandaracinaceae bacterium]